MVSYHYLSSSFPRLFFFFFDFFFFFFFFFFLLSADVVSVGDVFCSLPFEILSQKEKYSVSLKTPLQQGISEPEIYGDLVYRFRKIVGKSNFSEQFRKLIYRYKSFGYSLDIMRQTACLVVNLIIVDGYASLFNCTTAVRASDL